MFSYTESCGSLTSILVSNPCKGGICPKASTDNAQCHNCDAENNLKYVEKQAYQSEKPKAFDFTVNLNITS